MLVLPFIAFTCEERMKLTQKNKFHCICSSNPNEQHW